MKKVNFNFHQMSQRSWSRGDVKGKGRVGYPNQEDTGRLRRGGMRPMRRAEELMRLGHTIQGSSGNNDASYM